MDKGTNCLPVLQNKIIHLSLGWVGVINRNHKDLVKRKNLSDCAETERMYFQSHDVYKKISYRCGSMYLQKSITETLKKNIRKCFPILRDGINEQIRECTTNIEKLQKYIGFENDADEANYIIQSAKELNYKIKESLGTSHQSLELEKVSIGVIIQQILNISFIHEYNNIEIYKNTQKDIQIGVENACGVPGFIEIPDVVIRSIVQKNIESMRLCTLKVIKMVQNKLFECIRQSINSDCPYPNLNDCLRLLSLNYIISATANLNNTVNILIICF
uniref:Dynamin (Trinotate prediction) n=1 Tax=Henneguya salminicola TaxID=69463 RepID=A0A6G3MDW7_HENSL